ncbi:hypothetical protein [Acaryochloris sp. IP29b_bin.137]|uniref:hypothetical protein n=1 Tax=Acaryochloris sp. IP29b_bin.137 TaxID=2969217 RepID=UPI00260E5478|nr:hypothetical protein [Acaryochloris sp. IP29b_bin.137]
MKRSSKRHKVMDVSAAETPAAPNQPPTPNRLEKDENLSQSLLFEDNDASHEIDSPFDDDYFDESDSGENLYDEDFGDEYNPDFTDEFMQMHQRDESDEAFIDESDEAFIDEVIQSLTKSFELDLEQDVDGVADVRHILEHSMLEALDAATTTEFFEHILNTIDRVTPPIRQRTIQPGPRRKRKSKARAQNLEVQHNGHQHRRRKLEHNGQDQLIPLEDLYQPLACILRETQSMFRRYSLRGLDELDALEDTATLFAELNVDAARPILTGLTARVVIRPKLEQTSKKFSSAFCARVFKSADQAVTTLIKSGALQALPGVACNLGQLAIRKGLSAKALPRLLRNSATRTAASPKLIKHLSSSNPGAVTLTSARQSERPLQLRVNGPLEIIIRTPLES